MIRERTPVSTKPDRLSDIDRLKGFAIALVVWGHIASFAPMGSPSAFYISIAVIYSFHMPVFMYLSGFVFFHAGLHERFWNAPYKQIANRFDRLMIPFLFFGVLVLLGKYVVGQFVALPDPVESLSVGFVSILRDTPDNPSASIWYLLVIFVYAIATPLLWRLGRARFLLLFAVGIAGWIIPLPADFYASRVGKYFLFFAIGGFVATRGSGILAIIQRYALVFVGIFVLLCVFFFAHPLALLICGLSAIPALHGVFRQHSLQGDRLFATLGRNSMAIYLMNTIFIGLAGIALLMLGVRSWALFALLFLAGMIGPLIVKAVFDRVGPLKPLARYLA